MWKTLSEERISAIIVQIFSLLKKGTGSKKCHFCCDARFLRVILESSLTDASKVFSHWIFLKLFPWWIIKIPSYLSGWKKNRLLWNLYARLRLINLPAPTTPERREERIERNCLWNSPCAFLFGNWEKKCIYAKQRSWSFGEFSLESISGLFHCPLQAQIGDENGILRVVNSSIFKLFFGGELPQAKYNHDSSLLKCILIRTIIAF